MQPTGPRPHSKIRNALEVATTAATLVAAASLVWTLFGRAGAAPAARPPVRVPTDPVSLDGAPILGAANAKAAIIEFSDFECPFCARFSTEIFPAIKAQYIDSGRVKLAFRHLPLAMHQRAVPAAEAAECAERQGKFWPFHDALFREPRKLSDADLAAHAAATGLDDSTFSACRDGQAAERVKQDAEMAKALQLTGTPAFLLGTVVADGRVKVSKVITGARPVADFAAALDEVLSGS